MNKKIVRLFISLLLATSVSTAAAAPVATVETGPVYAQTASYFIPYSKSADGLLRVNVSVNGGPIVPIVVDTGSSQLCISANHVGEYTPGTAGSQLYTSSGIIERGNYSDVTVDFVDSSGSGGATGTAKASIQALVVTSSTAKNGAVNKNPNTAMMGIGFGHQQSIALLNISSGKVSQGYILGPTGITVGLTATNTRGFSLAPLTLATGGNNHWNYPQATLVVTQPEQTTYSASNSSLLMDSGITGLILGIAGAPTGGAIPAGTTIEIAPTNMQPAVAWTVVVDGSGKQISPTGKSRWEAHQPFLNTGGTSLKHFWYLYDYAYGYWGLKSR